METSIRNAETALCFAEWLESARRGQPDALGCLLETCRAYLLMVANRELDVDLQAKESPSDLVQQTCLEAHTDFQQFHGQTEPELIAWLRCILQNNIANASRRYRETAMRDIGRELRLDDSSAERAFAEELAAGAGTPSGIAMSKERVDAVRDALSRLPELYRRLILLHHEEDLPFSEIGQRLGRSEEAARKLWVRAVANLQDLLQPLAASEK